MNYYGYHDSRCHGHMALTHTHTYLLGSTSDGLRDLVAMAPWPRSNGDL